MNQTTQRTLLCLLLLAGVSTGYGRADHHTPLEDEVLHTPLPVSSPPASAPNKQHPTPVLATPHAILQGMTLAQKKASVGNFGSLATSFLGTFFTKFWHLAWRLVSNLIVHAVGREKIFELHPDGSYKRDAHGRRLPAVITVETLDDFGRPIKQQTISSWYPLVTSKETLLGSFAMAGINQTIRKTLRAADKLFFRPIVHKMLGIPLWKLSYTHYLLAMHERMYPHEALLHPERLTRAITTTKHRNLLSTARLPFPLARIMNMQNQGEKYSALHHAITKHLWKEYQEVWLARHDPDPGPLSLKEQVVEQAQKIGTAALVGKLQEGPIAPLIIATNVALSIPRALAESLGTGSIPPTRGNQDIVHYIDLLDAISREVRRGTHDTSQPITVRIENGPEHMELTLTPGLQSRLLARQESLLSKYRPFLDTTLEGESYEVYIKRLILPHLIYHVIPQKVREDNAITKAKIAKNIKKFGTYFDRTLTALQGLTSLLALTQTLKDHETYAGNYVTIADTIDSCMLSISLLLKSWGVHKDKWGKRFKGVLRKTYGDHISTPLLYRLNGNRENWPWSWIAIGGSKVFTVSQRQQIQRAMKKAGIASPGFILLDDAEAIKAYLRGEITEAELPGTFGYTMSGEEQLERARHLQEGRYSSEVLNQYDIAKTITMVELKEWVNGYSEDNPAYGTVSEKELADNATTLLLQTLALLRVEHQYQEDLFFTDGTAENEKQVAEKIAKIQQEMLHSLKATLGQVRAGLELFAELYGTYGLREILAGFDAHYKVTGEILSDMPPARIGKIVMTEGMPHVLGLGVERILQHLAGPLIMQLSRLQGVPVIDAGDLDVLLKHQASRFIGGANRKGLVYAAVRELSRNMIAYGSKTVLTQDALIDTVMGSYANPDNSNDLLNMMTLHKHAQMAEKSGRESPPTIQQKLKEMGPALTELQGFDPFAAEAL